MKRILVVIMMALLSGAAYSQDGSPAADKGQAASQQGFGPRGRMMRFNDANTPGWSMMTPDERRTHREKMYGFKSVEECRAYHDEHRKLMEARAQERGIAMRPMRGDPCSTMRRRGWLRQ